jgi:hypothetical protein
MLSVPSVLTNPLCVTASGLSLFAAGTPSAIPAIPAVGPGAVAALALLLGASGLLIVRRRRVTGFAA